MAWISGVMMQDQKISEKDLAILFADIGDYTSFAESLPAYDVIHALRRYFITMGKVIDTHGGKINDYVGDGIMALFPGGAADAARAAVEKAARSVVMVDGRDRFPASGLILDTRNDGRTAILFLANPRGIQYDAIADDASGAASPAGASVLMAAPVAGAMMLAYVTMGIMGRAVPQLNLFVIGFPLTIAAYESDADISQ